MKLWLTPKYWEDYNGLDDLKYENSVTIEIRYGNIDMSKPKSTGKAKQFDIPLRLEGGCYETLRKVEKWFDNNVIGEQVMTYIVYGGQRIPLVESMAQYLFERSDYSFVLPESALVKMAGKRLFEDIGDD